MTVAVRTDLTAGEVREQARAAATPDRARRLLAIALVLEGASREDAARSAGMDRQTLRSIAARSTGAPLQRGRGRWPGRPQGSRPATAPEPRPARRVGALPGAWPRDRAGRGGAVAPDRPLRPVTLPWSSGASASATRSGAWASSSGRSASAGPRPGRSTRDPIPRRKPSSKKLPDLIAAKLGEQAAGKRVEIWFQDEARIGQKGEPTRPSGAPTRPLRCRRSIGAADAGRAAAAGRDNRATSATRPPICSPPPAPRPRRPPRSCCRRSTSRP